MDLTGVPDRIARKLVERPDGCWTWLGAGKPGHYGAVWWNGTTTTIHRVLYKLLVGPVDDSLVLDHIVCEDKTCANPWHTQPSANLDNLMRERRRDVDPTVCKYGHRKVLRGGKWRCNECERERARLANRRARGIPDDWPAGKHFHRRGGGTYREGGPGADDSAGSRVERE